MIRTEPVSCHLKLMIVLLCVLSLAACAQSPADAAVEQGKRNYKALCATCHLEDGSGMPTALADSRWVGGSEEALIRIILQGKKGSADMDMPPHKHLKDDQIASILTYLRQEWGRQAPPVDSNAVAAVREATRERHEAWTERELSEIEQQATATGE